MKKTESKIKSSIIIEKEFQNLIPKLSAEERSGEAVPKRERSQLSENIKTEGAYYLCACDQTCNSDDGENIVISFNRLSNVIVARFDLSAEIALFS